jgi:hypothetical protein
MIATYRILADVNRKKNVEVVMSCARAVTKAKAMLIIQALYPNAKKIENLRYKKH